MKVKRMVRRLMAVGTGAAMLGATAMGALAADLGSYPDMFVTDGAFNGYFVVGENAKSVDNLAMTDIAASMKTTSAGGSTTTTVSGDAWMVGTSAKKLELANSNASASTIVGEVVRDINTFIGDEELGALADGGWATNEQTYDYQQFLFFDTDATGQSSLVKYAEDDADTTADFFFIGNSKQIARYKLEFSSTAQSDVTDSSGTADATGTYLWDFEDTDISIMGKPFTVVQARRAGSPVDRSVKLILMQGSSRDTLLEGESKTYTVGDKTYDVTLTYVDASQAKFTVNGQSTNKLNVGDTYVLSDTSEIGVSEVLYQSYAGGIHSATFFVGASKMELRDDDITTGTSTHDMKIGSEAIDGAAVIITGTDDNTTFSVSTIEINMTAQDDFFVGSGAKLSDVIAAEDEEKEVLVANTWDVEYKGLTEEETHDNRLRTSSSRRYVLTLFDGDGNAADLPVAYAEAAYDLTAGEESNTTRTSAKALIVNESATIYKNDYLVVTSGDNTAGAAKSYLLQYKGADRVTKTSPKVKFKNIGSGETLEYSVTDTRGSTTNTIATIKLGGNSFAAANNSPSTADDFQVTVDMDGDGTALEGATYTTWADSYGAVWTWTRIVTGDNHNNQALLAGSTAGGNATNADHVTLTMDPTLNGDDFDNHKPTLLTINITADTTEVEVRAAMVGLSLLTPEGETEVKYGYTSQGTWVKHAEPSGDPDDITWTYPSKQRIPQVYFTSGATTTASSSSGGNLVAVAVVDATKLDSEVATANAQNLVVVGGPCVNTVAAELLGNPAVCTEGFTPGKARVKLVEHTNGNMAMLVAGYSGADTRLAGRVIAHRWAELSGSEVEIEGTTYSDATIGAPMAAAAPAAEEPAADEAAE